MMDRGKYYVGRFRPPQLHLFAPRTSYLITRRCNRLLLVLCGLEALRPVLCKRAVCRFPSKSYQKQMQIDRE